MQQTYSMRSDVSTEPIDTNNPRKTSGWHFTERDYENKWTPTYSRAAHIAADTAKSKTSMTATKDNKTNPAPTNHSKNSSNSKTSIKGKAANIMNGHDNDTLDRKIDPSLIRTTNRMATAQRHSLVTKSNTKKLKKRQGNKHDTKRGSISTLRSYHYNQRISRNQIRTSDDLDINLQNMEMLWVNNKIGITCIKMSQWFERSIAKIGLVGSLVEMSSILTTDSHQSKQSANDSFIKQILITNCKSPPMAGMSKHASINSQYQIVVLMMDYLIKNLKQLIKLKN